MKRPLLPLALCLAAMGGLLNAQEPSPTPGPAEPVPRATPTLPPEPTPFPPLPTPTPTPTPPPVVKFQPAIPLPSPTPRPRIPGPGHGQVRLRLTGNAHFTEEQIRNAITDSLASIDESGLSPALADDTAFFLGVFYRKNGFSQAEVKWDIAPGNTLVLTIHEGPLTQLGNVTFRGNEHLPAKTLLDYVEGATRERLPRNPRVLPYVESDVKSGVERIRGLYHSEGYLDAVVDEPVIALSPDKTRANVVVSVHEGIQYRFGPLSFEGDIVFYPQRDLLKELEVFTSKPYTPLAVTNLERKVVYFYKSRGYFMAAVHAESDPAQAVNGRVPVKFVVEAGDIYRFDGVTQSGLRKLRPGFLKNRFKSFQGQIYNPAKLEERYRLLMGTGLFSNLKLTQKPLPNHEVELHFDVEEAKARELGFSVGYGSLEGAIVGARYVDRNLFGYGRPLSINLEVAQQLLRGEFIYTDPWILESDYTLRLRLYALNQDLNDYTKIETGLRTELSRKIGKHFEVTGFLLTRAVQISNQGIDPEELGPTNYRANSVGVSFTLDYRDSVLNPRRGLVINATSDLSLSVLGSSLDFFRTTFRASYYLPIGKTLLAAGVRGGAIFPLDDRAPIPIDERFFNGGSRSVRSYVERSLGPHDSTGHAVGGETFGNANIEDVFPLFGNLDGAVFFDAGSVGRRVGSGLGQTGYAIGPGLRYRLPIGPIRLDYGWNPLRRAHEPAGAWQFSFGFAF